MDESDLEDAISLVLRDCDWVDCGGSQINESVALRSITGDGGDRQKTRLLAVSGQHGWYSGVILNPKPRPAQKWHDILKPEAV